MTHISDRVQALAPSATLAMSQKSNELKAQGVDVINLSVGEPDFETPLHNKEAAKRAIDENFTFYTPVPGYMSLRKAVSEKLSKENGVSYAPEQIVVSNGAKQALCNVILATINPGDEVIIPMPAWVSYVEMVKLAGGTTVEVHADITQDFKMTPAQLEAAITPATRMLLLCSPSNPTGSIYSREELEALVKVLAKYPDIMVLADEIYEHINFTGSFTSMASFPEIADRTIIINGVSKAYAMTGWRIGYCAAPQWLAKAVAKLQGQYTSNASSIAQKAAEAAYTGPQVGSAEGDRSQGAFYLFPEVSAYIGKSTPEGAKIASSADLAMYLLEKGHVATVDGGAFGMEGYIRLSYATSDENLREAMKRIAETLASLS